MMDEPVKRLRILAGPNGSGKTSVYHTLLKNGHPDFGILVNADTCLEQKVFFLFKTIPLKLEKKN